MATLLVTVMVEDEAREQLEARYLGGQPALFADAEDDRNRFAEQVDRLWSISERLKGPSGSTENEAADEDPLAGRVADRVRRLSDDARISTFERLGEMPRAVAIMRGC